MPPPSAGLPAVYEADRDRQRDLLQEMHMELWVSFRSFDGRCSLRTWVYRIAHNVGASHVVRARRLASRLVGLETLEARISTVDGESEADRSFSATILLDLVHRLKPLDRQVILLYLEGEAAGQIAEVEPPMPEPEEPREPDTPVTAWRSQAGEQQQSMQVALTPGELCAMAQAREKLNARVIRAVAVVTVALAAALVYNAYRIDQPWIRLGQAWTLGVIVYLFGPALQRGRPRMGAGEPCAQFLARQHEERQRGYLRLRRRLFLFVPGIAASWWGGGPVFAAKARGLAPSSRLFHFFAGPWPFLITGIALVLVWLAFGKAAAKAGHECKEVRRSIAP
jgi:RNA polymerase sigma-70 factor (ECF subfamily)